MATSQHKWQKWSVPLLMGLNLLFLAFMLWQQFKPEEGPQRGPQKGRAIEKLLVKELALNETQTAEYKAMIKEHQSRNRTSHQKLRRLMDKQISLMGQAGVEDEIDLIAQEIGGIHADLIRSNAEHFAELREILNPEQQEKFQGLLKEVMGKMGRQMGPGGHRPPPPRH
ncbi:MAG: periplasmic heavy metal sensor [Bacteroidota bacterium]